MALFPPKITYKQMPPVIIKADATAKVYFTFTSAEQKNLINEELMQVQVNYIGKNKSALKTVSWPTEIAFAALSTEEDTGRYYIEVSAQWLKNGFELNESYQVRIRTTAKDTSLKEDQTFPDVAWLRENANNFSTWSDACIIQGIAAPTISINQADSSNDRTIESSEMAPIFSGRLNFAETNEADQLTSYSVTIRQNNGELLYTSDIMYPKMPNEIFYATPIALANNSNYYVDIKYATLKGWEDIVSFYLTTNFKNIELDDTISLIINHSVLEDNSGYQFIVTTQSPTYSSGIVTIERLADYVEGRYGDIIAEATITNGSQFVWTDYTMESDTEYVYRFNFIDSDGIIRQQQVLDTKLSISLEDIFLSNKDAQVRVMYNPTISNFKYAVAESTTNTIGSKFPYIRRNGKQYYRQFSIGGLISCIDYHKNSLLKDTISDSRYTRVNSETVLNYDKVALERFYREQVIEFLYNNSVKLFRSAQEGNILVQLTGVSLSPEETSGRALYSFTATATEVADATVDNYEQEGIIPMRRLLSGYPSYYEPNTSITSIPIATSEKVGGVLAAADDENGVAKNAIYVDDFGNMTVQKVTVDILDESDTDFVIDGGGAPIPDDQ